LASEVIGKIIADFCRAARTCQSHQNQHVSMAAWQNRLQPYQRAGQVGQQAVGRKHMARVRPASLRQAGYLTKYDSSLT
jgi:hypothetical protein